MRNMVNPQQSHPQYDPRLSELISLIEASERTGMTRQHLGLLLRNEKLWGAKLGRDWYTTQEALDDYLAQGNRPGVKPRLRLPNSDND